MRLKRIYPGILAFLMLTLALDPIKAEVIHPSLVGPRRWAFSADSIDIWVFFSDRGFPDQAALQQALDQAERNLLPAARTRRQKVKTGGRLVAEHDLPVNAAYARAVFDLGGRYRTASRYLNAVSVRIPWTKLTPFAQLPFVREIQPVAKGWRSPPQPDWSAAPPASTQPPGVDQLNYGPSYAQLNQINVVAVHDSGYSGAEVLVCLLDTGFYTDHEALINQPVVAEWDFINNDPETQNEPGDDPTQHNHGTYTFSALGGAHAGDLYGPAYGASFIIGKTESVEFELPIEEDWYFAGLEWADSLGAQIVSTSLGYLDWYTFEDLDGNTARTTIGVDDAVANGIVCITAAGNERQSAWGHIIAPADADSVIAVGAVDSLGEIASFSSPGPTYDGRIKPEVCARGVSTWCAVPWFGPTGYAGVGGTSLSTPLVGGSCALILEAHPDWTPMQVRQALMMTASNAQTPDNDYGWGIIDVLAAINYNFPPEIVQRHPQAGSIIVFQDSLQDFWVSTQDYEGDPLLFHWLVDSDEVYYGPDSVFSTFWAELGLYSVRVIVEDSQMGLDSTEWAVQVEPWTSIMASEEPVVPANFALHCNFPNPFNSSTTICFDLPRASQVRLAIYDLTGRTVAALVDDQLDAGRHALILDDSGLTSGLYICRMVAGNYNASIKLVYAK